MLRSKKGFSLVELTIVIAITAIVITMVCGFVITYRQQSDRVHNTGNTIADLNKLKSLVNDWITEYDMSTSDGITVTAGGGLASGEHTLTFDASKKSLVWKDGSKIHKSVSFDEISSCKFSSKENVKDVVYCQASGDINNKNDSVWMAFNISSGSERERYWNNAD